MSREGDESVYYKASVIIPVYQAETTLRRCVESVVLGQERDIEVVLVEDCSKDRSWQVCQELTQEFSNVIAVQNEKNSGVSYTRNHGLELAQGEYVLFVDSDDWVSKKYVLSLYALANKYPEMLVMCALHFIDRVQNYRQEFLWDRGREHVSIVEKNHYFDLLDAFFMQSPCNKIFRKRIIEDFAIRFDESQSMGEDFQFVLDYLEAAQIQKCVILNESLYYYIRWNDTSLMSQFGLSHSYQDIQRLERLFMLSGLEDRKVLSQQIEGIKHNYVYHIFRNTKLHKEEKMKLIEQVMQDGLSQHYYVQQQFLLLKEKSVKRLNDLKRIPGRIKNKFLRMIRTIKIWRVRSMVKTSDVTIISQNCMGGVIYHDLRMQFLSPTINLFIKEPDFVHFVLNLEHYMQCKLEMSWEEEYPVGRLEDVEIHFMHYETCKEAKEKWEHRKQRINWDKILILASDQEGFDEAVFQQWKKIPYSKILFTSQLMYAKDQNSVFFPEYGERGIVWDLIANRKFYKDGKIVKHIKD